MSEEFPSNHPLDRFLLNGDVLHVADDGQMLSPSTGRCPPVRVLLPGSFNPLLRGHWELAQVAEQMIGAPAAFELSVANVDKPTLTRAEIHRRLMQFNWQASVLLTHAAKFVEKAECFPGAMFVVGADTALRIVSSRYYQDDEPSMLKALARIRELECRFLVACRVDLRGQCLGKSDLPIPAGFQDLFVEIPPVRFRWDVSSTELRTRSRKP